MEDLLEDTPSSLSLVYVRCQLKIVRLLKEFTHQDLRDSEQ